MLKLLTDEEAAARMAALPTTMPSAFDVDDSPEEQARKLRLANLVYAVVNFPAEVLAGAGWRTWQ